MTRCFLLIASLIFSSSLRLTIAPNNVTYAYLPRDVAIYDFIGGEYHEICTLPKTYFVSLTGETDDGFFLANYLDLNGFVRSRDVEVVDYEPQNKYHSQSGVIKNEGLGANVRIDASINAEILLTLAENSVVRIYGYRYGTNANGEKIKWSYVRDGDTFGYVNSNHMLIDEIAKNEIVKVPKPNDYSYVEKATINKPTEIILIICLSVPVAVLTILAFRKKGEKKRRRKPSHFLDE